MLFAPVAINCALYLIYLCSCMKTQTMVYLSNIVDYSYVDDYIQRMKMTKPSVWMHVRCWHTKRVKKGKQTKTVTVNTYQEKEEYIYDVCTDVTPFSGFSMGKFSLVAVDSVLVKTMSSVSQRKFDAQYESLRGRNCHRDKNTTMTEGAALSGLVEHYLVKAPGGRQNIFLNTGAYFWACLFMLYIPYQIWFESQTGAARLHFCKDITNHEEQAEAEAIDAALVDPNLGGYNEAPLATAGDKQAGWLVDHLRGLQLALQQGLISDAEFNRARMAAIGIFVPASHEAVPLKHAASLGPSAPSAAGGYGGQMSLSFLESSSTPEASGRSIKDELQHLEDLRNNGTITQAMLEAERAMLLAEIPAADAGLGV